jgi:hypothetical protein
MRADLPTRGRLEKECVSKHGDHECILRDAAFGGSSG